MKAKNGVNRKQTLKGMAVVGMAIGLSLLGPFSVASAKGVYPDGQITFICSSNAGGGMDISARAVSVFLPPYMKQVSSGAKGGDIIIKNEGAASGTKAFTNVWNADPDGYTIGDFTTGHLSELALGYEKTKPVYDIRKFTWLLTSNMSIYVMVARKNGPATWEEMLAQAKKSPLKWVIGSYGGIMHVNSIWLKEELDIPAKFIIVPTATGVVSNIMRGDCDVALIPVDSAKAMIDGKEANVLVSFTEKRYFPEVPTIGEKGYPQFPPYMGGYRFVMGPPNLESEAKRVITEAGRKMFSDQKYQDFCLKAGSALCPLVGSEVEQAVYDRTKFYETIVPMLKKHMRF